MRARSTRKALGLYSRPSRLKADEACQLLAGQNAALDEQGNPIDITPAMFHRPLNRKSWLQFIGLEQPKPGQYAPIYRLRRIDRSKQATQEGYAK